MNKSKKKQVKRPSLMQQLNQRHEYLQQVQQYQQQAHEEYMRQKQAEQEYNAAIEHAAQLDQQQQERKDSISAVIQEQEHQNQQQNNPMPIKIPTLDYTTQQLDDADKIKFDENTYGQARKLAQTLGLQDWTPQSYEDQLNHGEDDPYAFKDAIKPYEFDATKLGGVSDEYHNWAVRQSQRDPNNPNTIEAKNYIKRTKAAIQAEEEGDYEHGTDQTGFRLNQRLFETQLAAIGIKNKKPLTQKEIGEIITYQAMHDPTGESGRSAWKYINDSFALLNEQTEKEKKDLESVENPYHSGESPINLAVSQFGGVPVYGSAPHPSYEKSFVSDFILETNKSQLMLESGKVARSREFLNMVPDVRRYINIVEQMYKNNVEIQQLQGKLKTPFNRELGYILPEGVNAFQKRINELIEENHQMRMELNDGQLRLNAENLASWEPRTLRQKLYSKTDSYIDNDLGGIRRYLGGLTDRLNKLNQLSNTPLSEMSYEEYQEISKLKEEITGILDGFEQGTSAKQEDWRKNMLIDAKDIIDWQTGDNWMSLKANVDNYYAAQKKLNELENFTWSNPVRMAAYGWSGIAGGSNSSWWKSAISIGAKVGGAVGGFLTTGGTSTAIQAAAIAVSYNADKMQGDEENNIEANNRTQDALRRRLQNKDKYESFLQEGIEQVYGGKLGFSEDNVKKIYQDLFKLNEKDRESIEQFVLNTYLGEMWHSADPEITKMHAAAVIGVNNQFYNNELVNTGDAMIGSAVAILNLEPIKYFARSAKIIGASTLSKLASTKLGKQAALRYAGFKANTAKSYQQLKAVTGTFGKTSPIVVESKELGSLISGKVGPMLGRVGQKTQRIWTGVEYPIARRYAKVRAYASQIPSVFLNASKTSTAATKIKLSETAKTAANVATRLGIDDIYERTQEGIQGLSSYGGDPWLNDKVGSIEHNYEVQRNRNMLDRLIEDLSYASTAWQLYFNREDPAYYTDADVVGSMNATPLLTFFGPNMVQVGIQAHNLNHRIKMIDFLANQIDSDRRSTVAQIEQGKYFARYLSKEDHEKMMDYFERFKKHYGTHRNRINKLNALERLLKGKDRATLLDPDENAIPDEMIDAVMNDYERIYRLGNSTEAYMLAVAAGIFKAKRDKHGRIKKVSKPLFDFNTKKKFAKLVSMYDYRTTKYNDALEKLEETDQEGFDIFGTLMNDWYDTYEEPLMSEEPKETSKSFLQHRADEPLPSLLTKLAMFFQLQEDYKKVPGFDNEEKSNDFLARIIYNINQIKDQLKKYNVNFENRDEIVSYLENSIHGQALYQNFSQKLKENPEDQDLSIEEIVDKINKFQRRRVFDEYDLLLQEHLFDDFLIHPNYQIKKYDDAQHSDEELERILEAELVQHLREEDSAKLVEPKTGDVYVTSVVDDANRGTAHNEYRIVEVRENEVGDKEVVTHRYYPKSRVIEKEDLEFDSVEYARSAYNSRQAALKRMRRRKQNENLASSTRTNPNPEVVVNNEEPVEATEEPVEEATGEPTEEATGGGAGAINIQIFLDNEEVWAKDGVTGDFSRHIVKSFDPKTNVYTFTDGSTANADDIFYEHHFTKTSPINIGDEVLYKGKKYKVVDSKVVSINQNTYEAVSNFIIKNENTGDTIEVSENEVEVYVEEEEEETPKPKGAIKEAKANAKQKETLSKLQEYYKNTYKLLKKTKNNKNKLSTGHNYFIKIKNKYLNFIRVHGVLDKAFGSMFESSTESQEKRESVFNELDSLRKDGKLNELAKRIIELQDEYNNNLASKYGADSDIYARYSIDLSIYVSPNKIDSEILKDEDTPYAVAEMVSREIPNAAVIAGTTIDQIFREFFKNKGKIENKPEYKMSNKVFNELVEQLYELAERFAKNGLVVDTNDYTWYGVFNGIRVAGETDMIVIDRKGNIQIFDFKTTNSRNKLNIDNIDNRSEYANRSYGAQYALQLEAYRLLIQDAMDKLGVKSKVTSFSIIPIYLTYETSDDGILIKNISGTKIQDIVDLSEIPELKQYISDIDNYLNAKSDEQLISKIQYESNLNQLEQLYDSIEEILDNENYQITNADHRILSQIQQEIIDYKERWHSKDRVNGFDNWSTDENTVDELISDYNKLQKKASEKIQSIYDDNQDQNHSEEDEEDEELPYDVDQNDEMDRWWNFNRLHSHTDYLKNLKGWMESIIKKDFIKNSIFEITRGNDADGKMQYRVRVTYSPLGQKPIKFTNTFEDDIILLVGNENLPNNQKNTPLPEDGLLSSMGRKFIRDYEDLLSILKPGQTIIATKVKRTNGVLVVNPDKEYNLTKTMFFQDWEDKIYNLFDGEDSIVGLADDTGSVIQVAKRENGMNLVIYSSSYYDTVNVKDKEMLPGNTRPDEDSNQEIIQGIPPGSVVFLYKFKYDEDEEDDKVRTIPLVLKGRKLDENDVNFIIKTIQNRKELNSEASFSIKNKGKRGWKSGNKINGLTNRKLLQMLTRFGGQAQHTQQHEFIFNYGTRQLGDGRIIPDYSKVVITDMRKPASTEQQKGRVYVVVGDQTESVEYLHRPVVELSLNDKGDLKVLSEILQLTNMHVNQRGIMHSELNENDKEGWFGELGEFFEDNSEIESIKLTDDKNIVFDREDVEPNEDGQNLTFTGWTIKHGHVTTNAQSITNPLISIHELGILDENKEINKRKAEKKKERKNSVDSVDDGEEPIIDDSSTETRKKKSGKVSKHNLFDDDDILNDEFTSPWDSGTNAQFGNGFRIIPLRQDQIDKIKREIKRLLGKRNIIWHDEAVEVLQSGAKVAGRVAVSAIHLSKKMQYGVHYHEAFHDVLELLTPEFIRKKLYAEYRKMYGEAFYANNGRELTDHDISEGLAEMFREFQMNRPHYEVNKGGKFLGVTMPVIPGLLQTFRIIREYDRSLARLNSRTFAYYFELVNSGIFRFAKPNASRIERFINVLNGQADFSITGKVDGKRQRIKLNEFPGFGGNEMFSDAVDVFIHAFTRGCSLDSLASNANLLKTDLYTLQHLFKDKEKTEHSAWYRVISGEYAKSGEVITTQDVIWFRKFNFQNPAYAQLIDDIIQEVNKTQYKFKKGDKVYYNNTQYTIVKKKSGSSIVTLEDRNGNKIDAFIEAVEEDTRKVEARKEVLNAFAEIMYQQQMDDDLDQSQKQIRELTTEENWKIVEQKINRKLEKFGIDTVYLHEKKRAENKDTADGNEDEDYAEDNGLYSEIVQHDDEASYQHSRIDDASSAIKYFLSTIPDERFATAEDVESGLVSSIYDKNNRRRTIANGSNLFGLPVYLGMKTVSNKLLLACRTCKNAKELENMLQILSETDPVFQRIASVYHSYYTKEIEKHKDGKNRIKVNGKEVQSEKYTQHSDEDGNVYYVWSTGENAGSTIKNAETIINRNKESFVTQLLNYVSVQRHDFIKVIINAVYDEDGDVIDGKCDPLVKSSSSEYGSKILPRIWFARLLGGITGLTEVNGEQYSFTEDGKKELKNAITFLRNLRGTSSNGIIKIGNTNYNIKESVEDFDTILDIFISDLNVIGIDITKEAFLYGLNEEYQPQQRGITLADCFIRFLSSANSGKGKLSYKTFASSEQTSVLSKLAYSVKNNKILSISTPTYTERQYENGSNKEITHSSTGMYIYEENALIKWFAQAVYNYTKSQSDFMQHGANNTKLYQLAQAHTASDITDDMNSTHLDKNDKKTIIFSRVINDMLKYIYNKTYYPYKNGQKTAECLILKHFEDVSAMKLNGLYAPKLQLHTHGGVQLQNDYTGGESYKRITEREDYIAKIAILQQGGMLFPTLSDKSTWFYITGIKMPGLNYKNLSSINLNSLLDLRIQDDIEDGSLHVTFNFNSSNDQIDQMIEYAWMERNTIEREIKRKDSKFPRIEFFNENRLHFGALSEIVIIDDNGKPKLKSLNSKKPNETNLESAKRCLKLADKYFFNQDRSTQRRIMAMTLEEGFMRNIQLLEKYGIIVANNGLTEDELDEQGDPTGNKIESNRLFQYSNVGLSDNVINQLKELYIDKFTKTKEDKTNTSKKEAISKKAESLAILQYVWDIYLRGVISNEETERIYWCTILF